MSEWQPIETVPRDPFATFLIGWAGEAQEVIVGFWNSTYKWVDWQDSVGRPPEQPTHWMPLPDGPPNARP